MSPTLHRTLRRTNRLTLLTEVATITARLIAVGLAAALLAILADAIIGFGQPLLLTIDFLFIGFAAASLLGAVRLVIAHRYDPRRMARLIEQRLGLHDSRLINAVEFAAAGATAGLAGLAVTEGEQFAATVQPQQVIDREPVRRAAVTASAALLITAILWLLTPGLFATVVARYLDPSADLPPFTLVKFHVQIDPAKIYAGQPATIHAKLTGITAPDQATIVFAEGDQRTRQPMIREATGLFTLPIDRADHSRRFYVETSGGRSGWFTLDVLPVPIFKNVTVRYEYPAYTQWPAMDHTLDGRGLQALVGTTVRLSVDSNLPLREGHLAVVHGSVADEVTLTPTDDPTRATGSFTLNSSGEFELGLISSTGVPSDRTVRGKITAIADGPPQVQLLEPDLRVVAPAGYTIPVTVAASDDVGLSRIILQHHTNTGPTTTLDLPLNRRGPTYATAHTTLNLAELNAKPGDTIHAFATAFDNRPGAAQSADSSPFEIAVVSPEEYASLARQQVTMEKIAEEAAKLAARADQLDELREKLRKKLEELRGRSDVTPEQAAELMKMLEEYARESAQLAEDMQNRADQPAIYDYEKPYQQQLKKLAEAMRQQAARAAASRSRMSEPTRQKLDELANQLQQDAEAAGSQKQERQLTQRQMKQLELADRIGSAGEEIKAIAARQRELAEKLAAVRETTSLTDDDKARVKRWAGEQAELKADLEQAMKDLEQAADEGKELLPKMTAGARTVLGKLRQLKVTTDQQDAADAAELGQNSLAHRSADTAASKLESLISQCNGMCNSMSDDLDGCFGLKKGGNSNALSQLGRRRSSGSGSGSGAGSGNGASGVSGASNSAAPGGSGRGTLMGPRTGDDRSFRDSDSKGPKGRAFGRARGAGDDARAADGPEDLTPTQLRDARGGPGTQGVPLQYRGLAEQYFRRLNETK